METVGGLIVLMSLIAIYILPGLIASARDHHNKLAIWVLNILLGWMLLGWVVALVWAFTRVDQKEA